METGKLRDRRFRNYVSGDLVIDRFLGEADLLIIRCNSSYIDFGKELVAPPIVPRHEWCKVFESLRPTATPRSLSASSACLSESIYPPHRALTKHAARVATIGTLHGVDDDY